MGQQSVTTSSGPADARGESTLSTLHVIAADIKIAHSVFALPFALLAAFMAAAHGERAIDWRRFAGQLALIVLAMIFARTVAMLANRLIDREIDARNPRTVNRALPSGRLSIAQARASLFICAIGFGITCALFGVIYDNWWPAILAAPVLIWISTYAYFKRFTALAHLYLGSALAISPLAAALAIEPAALAQPALWLLALMVLCWVAGFDIIYALQDIEIDRAQALRSIPARLGARGARLTSAALHLIALAALILGAWLDPRFGLIFGLAVAAVGLLLLIEHATVHRWGTSKIALSFFILNGVISIALGIAGIADILV